MKYIVDISCLSLTKEEKSKNKQKEKAFGSEIFFKQT